MKSKQTLTLTLATVLLSGCAGVATVNHQVPDADPFAYTNKKVQYFNDKVDSFVLKPLAKGYQAVIPETPRLGVRNFFNNLSLVPATANSLLQLDIPRAAKSTTRFVLNSTLGIFGFFDPATDIGFEADSNSFGDTLIHYGVTYSPYVVIPFLGPSTVRDTLGRFADHYTQPVLYLDGGPAQTGSLALDFVSQRAGLLSGEDVIKGLAVDRYTFFKNAYLQQRAKVGATPVAQAVIEDAALPSFTEEYVDDFE